jgi:putative acetyltransferase
LILREVRPGDHFAIASLTTEAFSAAFPEGSGGEAEIIRSVRRDGVVLVELVATVETEIVGHILFSRMACDPPAFVAALGPVSVLPTRQHSGVGTALCRAGLDRCRDLGATGAVVLGHPDYYPRFGFSTQAAAGLRSPYSGSPAFMAMALVEGGLTGVSQVAYPAGFA